MGWQAVGRAAQVSQEGHLHFPTVEGRGIWAQLKHQSPTSSCLFSLSVIPPSALASRWNLSGITFEHLKIT